MPKQARSFVRLYHSLILSCLLGAVALPLSGCGGQPRNDTTTSQAVGAPQQLYSEGRIGPFADVAPLELAPGGSLGALGLNLEPLYAAPLTNPNDRLDRLEATVLAMQADLQTLAPSMQRMAVVEQDLAAAVAELRDILNQQNTAATPKTPAKAAPAKATPKPAPKAAPVVKTQGDGVAYKNEGDGVAYKNQGDGVAGAILPDSGGIGAPIGAQTDSKATASANTSTPAIRGLRLGEHGNKTRLVFDVTKKPVYRTDLDNNEKLLIVEIDDAAWAGSIPAALSSPMVQSYSTQALDNGTRIIVVLKKSARISLQEVLGPDSANGAHRLVIDLTNG